MNRDIQKITAHVILAVMQCSNDLDIDLPVPTPAASVGSGRQFPHGDNKPCITSPSTVCTIEFPVLQKIGFYFL